MGSRIVENTASTKAREHMAKPDNGCRVGNVTMQQRPYRGLAMSAGMIVLAAAGTAANAAGVPDLEGTWTNVTMTRWERPDQYGGRTVMTPAEVAELEGAAAQSAELANRPTDPNATVETLPNDCSGGRSWCNYNAQWTETGDRVMRVNGEPRTSIVTIPASGKIPYRPGKGRRPAPPAEGATQTQQGPGVDSDRDNPEARSLAERCLESQNFREGALMTPTLYNNNYQIVQSTDAVAIIVEMSHDARIIRLNGKHRTDGVRTWFGDSIGRYEGDVLVVETTNFHPLQLARNSEKLKLTERFRRVGKDRILYQFTVEDPETYSQSWGGEYEFTPSNGPLFEYACHEGNRGMENILAGARYEEAQARSNGRPTSEAGR
jgi:hypothetical protein